jgi:DNA-binding CsgD family transcriptional regulator
MPSTFADYGICVARIYRVSPCSEEAARDHYERLVASQKYFYEDEEYWIAAAKGLLALSWGDRIHASSHFEEAIALCDKQEERPWRAHFLFELALLLAPAEGERAERLVQEAAGEAQRFGLQPLLARIDREWVPEGDRIGRAAAPAGEEALQAAGITRREREVLECLVEGLTDKEIAASLNISPYTVGNHLRNIYTKTECANRGEAAHWALAHHLAVVDSAESAPIREAGQ